MKFTILTLFPEMFSSIFSCSMLKRAVDKGEICIEYVNIRHYSKDKHKRVDDVPFGGGPGMLMSCEPLFLCIEDVKKKALKRSKVIYLTPQGKRFTQIRAEKLSKSYDEIILLCGHYEGIDQRVRDNLVDEEISIGDYVLTGGELPAAVLVDTVSRLIPGVIGKESSVLEESFSKALSRKREYPQYTRPQEFRGMKVPEVLLNGNHKEIEKWKRENLK